jgi:hypothetical protein
VDVLQLIFAALFLFLAGLSWCKRSRAGEPQQENKLLRRLDTTGVAGAGLLGLVQGFVVIKNLPLAVGAGARVGEAGLGFGVAVLTLVIALVATGGVIVPVIVAIVGGDSIAPGLVRAREWLEANMLAIGIVVLLVLAAFFLGQGLNILA